MAREGGAVLVRSDGSAIPWETFDADLDAAHVIALLYQFGADRWVTEWDERVGAAPTSMQVLATDTELRTGNGSGDAGRLADGEAITEIRPSNLTRVGVQVTRALDGTGETDHPVVVYLDSVTVMLQFVDLTTAYRFLHTLIGHVNAVGGTTYVGINPPAHDETTVSTFLQLFDEVRKG